MRRENQLVALADGSYMMEKEQVRRHGMPHVVTVESINRRFGLKKGQLRNYRANHYSR